MWKEFTRARFKVYFKDLIDLLRIYRFMNVLRINIYTHVRGPHHLLVDLLAVLGGGRADIRGVIFSANKFAISHTACRKR